MAAPTISNHNHSTSSGGTTSSISVTASSGDVIVVAASIGTLSGTTVPALSISGGGANVGTWHKIGSLPTSGQEFAVEAWYAITSGAVSAQSVTVTSSITIDDAALAYVSVSGANTTQPLDQNGSLATGASNGTSAKNYDGLSHTQSCSISTNTANTLAFCLGGFNVGSAAGTTAQSGSTLTESATNGGGANFAYLRVWTAPFTATQSGKSVGSSDSATWPNFAFAITADSQGGSVHNRRTLSSLGTRTGSRQAA